MCSFALERVQLKGSVIRWIAYQRLCCVSVNHNDGQRLTAEFDALEMMVEGS